MDEKLMALLEAADTVGIKDYIFEKEMEFYNKDMQTITITLGLAIPNYDCLVDCIGLENQVMSIDMYSDEKAMYSINTHRTAVTYLYFIRKEEFGLDDGYGVINRLIFSADITADSRKL